MSDATIEFKKAALIRDPSIPVGTRAALYIRCPCGAFAPAMSASGVSFCDVIHCFCGRDYQPDGLLLKGV